MGKEAKIICVVMEEKNYHMAVISPYTMKPGKAYRAAGLIMQDMGAMLASSNLMSLLFTPFDMPDLEDFSVIQIEHPMIARNTEAITMIPQDEEGIKSLLSNMMIGAKKEDVHRVERAPDSALKSNDALQSYLLRKFVETTYLAGSMCIKIG